MSSYIAVVKVSLLFTLFFEETVNLVFTLLSTIIKSFILVKRPQRKEYRSELKKYAADAKKANEAKLKEMMNNTYNCEMEEFLTFAKCDKAEYELFCKVRVLNCFFFQALVVNLKMKKNNFKAFDAEMNNTDGIAETELQSLMGLKLPVVIDQNDLQTYKSYGLSGFDKQAIKRATENPVVYQILLSRESNQIDEDIGGDSDFFSNC